MTYAISEEVNKKRIEKIKETKRKTSKDIGKHSKSVWNSYTPEQRKARLNKGVLSEKSIKTRFKKGQHPWNYKLTKETDKRVESISRNLKDKPTNKKMGAFFKKINFREHKRKSIGVEDRQKQSDRRKKYFSIEENMNKHKAKMKIVNGREEERHKRRIARSIQVFPFIDTSIELKMQRALQKEGIKFYTQVPLLKVALADLFIEPNIVIFCDGDYWHHYPDGLEKDHAQNKALTDANYIVLRFWEHDINNKTEECITMVKEKILLNEKVMEATQ